MNLWCQEVYNTTREVRKEVLALGKLEGFEACLGKSSCEGFICQPFRLVVTACLPPHVSQIPIVNLLDPVTSTSLSHSSSQSSLVKPQCRARLKFPAAPTSSCTVRKAFQIPGLRFPVPFQDQQNGSPASRIHSMGHGQHSKAWEFMRFCFNIQGFGSLIILEPSLQLSHRCQDMKLLARNSSPKGPSANTTRALSFQYRELLKWFGPSFHYLRAWTLWVGVGHRLSKASGSLQRRTSSIDQHLQSIVGPPGGQR